MQPYIPQLSYHVAPLGELLKKIKFSVGMTVLTPYSRSLTLSPPLFRAPSCSNTGEISQSLPWQMQVNSLRTCLLQHSKPTGIASKFLMDAEIRYANIRRELIAIVYACECFHMHLHDHSFTTETDHKPLKMLE